MLIYEYKLSGSNKQFAAIDEAIRMVLDRDHNAALNILAKALDGTLGHRETDERVS